MVELRNGNHRVVMLFAAVVLCSSICFAATVRVDDELMESSNATVEIPITLTSGAGESVAAVQFDVTYDASALNFSKELGIQPGASAAAAGKDVTFAVLESGPIRVIVAGFNQNVIADGPLAVLTFSRPSAAAPLDGAIMLTNLSLSDPVGAPVTAQPSDSSASAPSQELPAETAAPSTYLLSLLFFTAGAIVLFAVFRKKRKSAPGRLRG